MRQEETVQEVLARLARGESVKAIARELRMDRKTVKRWRRLGQWQPRQGRPRPCSLAPYLDRLAQRGPEVGWNAVGLHRELQGLGFTGGVQQVRRAIRPRSGLLPLTMEPDYVSTRSEKISMYFHVDTQLRPVPSMCLHGEIICLYG